MHVGDGLVELLELEQAGGEVLAADDPVYLDLLALGVEEDAEPLAHAVHVGHERLEDRVQDGVQPPVALLQVPVGHARRPQVLELAGPGQRLEGGQLERRLGYPVDERVEARAELAHQRAHEEVVILALQG